MAEIGEDNEVKSADLKDKTGYAINDWVEVVSRFTAHFNHDKTEYRKDVSVGERMRVVGGRSLKNGNWQIKVMVCKEQDGVGSIQTEWFLKPAQVKPSGEPGAGKDVPKKDHAVETVKPPAAFPYLPELPKDKDQKWNVFTKWSALNPENYEEDVSTKLKWQIGFAMMCAGYAMPDYVDTDFCVCQKFEGGKGVGPASVYANRNFKAHEVMFAPDTTEMKQRMYTVARSYLVDGGDKLDSKRKHTVLDGRLRSTPIPTLDGKVVRPFSIFFCVEHPTEDEDANLEISVLKVNVNVKFESPLPKILEGIEFAHGASKESDQYPMVGIPIMSNPKAVKKGEKLLCIHDKALERLAAKDQEEKAATAAAAAKGAVDKAAAKKAKKAE